MSAPAANALALPVNTIARTLWSASAARRAVESSAMTLDDSGFMGGRFRVTSVTAGAGDVTLINWYSGAVDCHRRCSVREADGAAARPAENTTRAAIASTLLAEEQQCVTERASTVQAKRGGSRQAAGAVYVAEDVLRVWASAQSATWVRRRRAE